MTVKMVELDTWLDEWDDGLVTDGVGPRNAQESPAESSHVIEHLLEALTNPGALIPFMENLTLWTATCDHLQTCEICRSGLAALAAIGDTPEGALGALMAHAAQDPARLAAAPRRARRLRSASRKRAYAAASPPATPAPDASALASYIAIVQNSGVATAAKQLPDVARHLRGCPRCRRDVSDALAALQSLEVSEPQK